LAASTKAFGQTAATPPAKTGYAPVNGLKLYYEIHGNGDPLVLLHGGLGSMEIFGELLPVLAKTRRVLAADLQAHGRAGDIDRPISYEALADDIAGLMKQLGIEKADVMGYSLGAGTALQTTIRHSASVRKLVVVSTVFKRNGWYPEILAAMAQLGPAVAKGLRLVERRRRDPSANNACVWRRGLYASGTCSGVLPTPGWRQEGWRLGWIRNLQRPPRHFAWGDALQHFLVTGIGAYGPAFS